jgi:hypothetical protein
MQYRRMNDEKGRGEVTEKRRIGDGRVADSLFLCARGVVWGATAVPDWVYRGRGGFNAT